MPKIRDIWAADMPHKSSWKPTGNAFLRATRRCMMRATATRNKQEASILFISADL